MYKNFIDNFPGNADSENALFFLGALYNREKEFGLSVDILQALLIKYPQTKWKRVARYYIGYGYELSGNRELAEEYYRQALDMYKQLGAEEALAPGELKVIRRLYGLLNASKKEGKSGLSDSKEAYFLKN